MSNIILLIPDWLASMALVASGPILLVALVLLGFALGGRRDGNEIRCRRCRYEFVRTAAIPDLCQECGTSTTARNALRIGVWRPRWRVLTVAIGGIVCGPSLVVLAEVLPSMKAAATRAGGIDAAIDQAVAQQPLGDLEQLHEMLHSADDDGSGTDARWLRFAERIEREPALRPLAIAYLNYLANWGNRRLNDLAVSDKSHEAFGRAIATVVKADPSLVESLPNSMGMSDNLPVVLLEQLQTDIDVLRLFLRGPVISIKHLVRERRNALRVMLVQDGLELMRREFVLESAEVFYGRRDGTQVEFTIDAHRMGQFRPELDGTFGTSLDISRPISDPLWDGTIRIDARVGHVAANNFGGGQRDDRILEDVLDYSWEIRVEQVDPKSLRVYAASESAATELVTMALQDVSIQVKPNNGGGTGGGGATLRFEMQPFGMVNNVYINLDAMIEQETQTWPVRSGAANPLEGFEIGRPFQLVLQGVAPESHESVDDLAYLAGRWTARYDPARRTPFEVIYTPDPKAAVLPAQPDVSPFEARRGIVVPGATVGPPRPVAETRSPAETK